MYDTNKYQYPAQQLIAEGRQFDRYNWRLYQRFADGQFDYKAWANNLGYVAVDYSDNNNSTENNDGKVYTYRVASVPYFNFSAQLPHMNPVG